MFALASRVSCRDATSTPLTFSKVRLQKKKKLKILLTTSSIIPITTGNFKRSSKIILLKSKTKRRERKKIAQRRWKTVSRLRREERRNSAAHISRALSSSAWPPPRDARFRWEQRSEENGRYPGNAGWVGAAVARQDTRGSSLGRNEFDASFPEWLADQQSSKRRWTSETADREDPKILHRPWNPRFLFEYAPPSDFDFAEFSPFSSTANSLHLSRWRDVESRRRVPLTCGNVLPPSAERNFYRKLLLFYFPSTLRHETPPCTYLAGNTFSIWHGRLERAS